MRACMADFYTALEVRARPRQAPQVTVRAMVDTGSEYSWIPADLLASLGIEVQHALYFTTATGEQVTRPAGYAFLTAEGRETVDVVVFAEPGDATLLGARTLEGFNVNVDPIAKRLVPGGPILVPANIAIGRAPGI